jgi:hypothetical protein
MANAAPAGMNATYPVRYHVEPPQRFTRIQLLIRVAAFCVLGMVGLSFGAVFVSAYLALPVLAAARISSRTPEDYVRDDGPDLFAALRWFAAASAWAGLIAERLPSRSPDETVRIEVDATVQPRPTPKSAMWRIVTGLPSALVLAVLCGVGTLVWLWAALSILFVQRVGSGAFNFLAGLQRWSIRLLAYQASLVDEYPPFALSDLQSSAASQPEMVRS